MCLLVTFAQVRRPIFALLFACAACLDVLSSEHKTRDDEFDQSSKIESQELTAIQIDNLAMLAKVWGFAKYHDARVIYRTTNWDYELFRVMPQVLAAPDRLSASAAIVTWLDSHGGISGCTVCAAPPTGVHLLPDFEWINVADLGEALHERLSQIYLTRPPSGAQRYVAFAPGVLNPDFTAEEAYAQLPAPDAGYRALALFRFWNIIQYWFPYRDVIGEDWGGVLVEFIPRVMRSMTANAYREEMIQLSARINDTHANVWGSLYLQPPVGFSQVPVAIRFVEDKAVVTGYTHPNLGPATGLAIGDVIEQIDGVSVETLVENLRPWYSASNQPTRLRDIAVKLTSGEGPASVSGIGAAGAFNLTVQRAHTSQLNFSALRQHDRPGDAFQMLSDSVAYIKISTAVSAHSTSYIQQALSARVLVIDIRNYPSTFPLSTLGAHLVSAYTPFAQFTVGTLANPGAFRWDRTPALTPALPRFTGPIAILVDEVTQSSAEFHAMAFRAAPNAFVVGSTTAGADGNVSRVPLPGGIESMFSGIGVFYPDHTPTQRVGIVPDFEVRPTIAGIRELRDEVLEAAVIQAFARESLP